MTVYYLCSETEADLIEALPMLRSEGKWVRDSDHHTLDTIGPRVLAPAVMADDGETVLEPPVFEESFRLNLLVRGTHPYRDAIDAAVQPYIVTPAKPDVEFLSGAG